MESYFLIEKDGFIEVRSFRYFKSRKLDITDYYLDERTGDIEKNDLYVKKDKELTHLQRAKRNIKDILINNLNEHSSMLTLTYKENITDYQLSLNEFNKFIKRLAYYIDEKVEYIAAKELQKRGAIHYHIVFFNEKIYNLNNDILSNIWKQGFTYFKRITVFDDFTIDKISNYLGKYLTDYSKGQMIELNKQMYHTSRGLKRTKNIRLTEQEFNEIIKSSVYTLELGSLTKYIIKKRK